MKVSTIFLTSGLLCALLTMPGCAKKEMDRCDHTEPQVFKVKITVSGNKNEKPKVDKETVHACHQDDIVFEGNVDDFSIVFKEESPFKKNLGSMRGKAIGKVEVSPSKKPLKYKYDVVVPGYPVLDPFIIIRTK